MNSNSSLFESRIDKAFQHIIDLLYGIFINKIYFGISITFVIVSSIIFLSTKNEYWLILSAPFTLPWFTLLLVMLLDLLVIPYTLTVHYLVEHKIKIIIARLIAFLVQIATLFILFLFAFLMNT